MTFTEPLNQNYQFRQLYRRGKSKAGPFVAVYCRRTGRPGNRLGLTVGTKVGKAVVRNYVRRRIKESYRLMEPKLRRGFDVVIVARGRSAQADFHQIDRDLQKQMRGLGLFLEGSPQTGRAQRKAT